MQVSVSNDAGKATVVLGGRFEAHMDRSFRSACEQLIADPAVHELRIDLVGVEHLDSSALGAILRLRDRAAAVHKHVVLLNGNGAVKHLLDNAHFAKLFLMA